MIDNPAAYYRNGFEAAVRVPGKTRDAFTVVHAPAVARFKILADVATRKGGGWSQYLIATRVLVEVVHAEQERVCRYPLKAQLVGR